MRSVGLVGLLMLALACGSSAAGKNTHAGATVAAGGTGGVASTVSAPVGGEQGICYPNGTCNAGLSCLSNLCVNAASLMPGMSGAAGMSSASGVAGIGASGSGGVAGTGTAGTSGGGSGGIIGAGNGNPGHISATIAGTNVRLEMGYAWWGVNSGRLTIASGQSTPYTTITLNAAGMQPGTYSCASGTALIEYIGTGAQGPQTYGAPSSSHPENPGSCMLNITKVGAVGDTIEGTFTANVVGPANSPMFTSVAITNGEISMTRMADKNQ